MPSPDNLSDLLLDAICVVDREGRLLSVTGACHTIFGYRPEEMVGRFMIDLVHPEDRARTQQAVRRIESGYLQRYFENRYVRKDGSVVHLMWSARQSAIQGQRIAVARDISMRSQVLPEERLDAGAAPESAAWRLSSAPPCLTPPGGEPVALSAQDYTVLLALAQGGEHVSRRSIIEALGENYLDYDQRRLDTQMSRLRRKVASACGERLPVVTRRAWGFRVYRPIIVD